MSNCDVGPLHSLQIWSWAGLTTVVLENGGMIISQRTGDELDLAEHDPARVELDSDGERAGDELTQRYVDGPRGLRHRVALVVVAHAGRSRPRAAVSGNHVVRLVVEHRDRGKDAHVTVKQVVGVNAHHAEVPHTVKPTHPHPRTYTHTHTPTHICPHGIKQRIAHKGRI